MKKLSRRTFVILAGVAVATACARPPAPARPAPLIVSVERYHEAMRGGVVGSVIGRAYEEPRTPQGPELVLTGIAIILLPRSPAVLSRLEDLKGGARDSMTAYLGAVTSMRRLREAYEAELWQAGAGDLVFATTVTDAGTFRLDGLPEGEWLLYASRSVFRDVPWPSPVRRDEDPRYPRFLKTPSVVGHYVVTVWLREVRVKAGASEAVDLIDRNSWFAGVAEDWEWEAKKKGSVQIPPGEIPPSLIGVPR